MDSKSQVYESNPLRQLPSPSSNPNLRETFLRSDSSDLRNPGTDFSRNFEHKRSPLGFSSGYSINSAGFNSSTGSSSSNSGILDSQIQYNSGNIPSLTRSGSRTHSSLLDAMNRKDFASSSRNLLDQDPIDSSSSVDLSNPSLNHFSSNNGAIPNDFMNSSTSNRTLDVNLGLNHDNGYSGVNNKLDSGNQPNSSKVVDFSSMNPGSADSSLDSKTDVMDLGDFKPQLSSPLKNPNIFSKSQIHLKNSNNGYVRSVPVSRQTSPEIDDLWKSFAQQNTISNKSDLNKSSRLGPISYGEVEGLGKSISMGVSSNNLNSEIAGNKPFEYSRNHNLLGSRSNSGFLNFKDGLNYDGLASNQAINTDFDPHLPQGLLEDDEGLYMNRKVSPANYDLNSGLQDFGVLGDAPNMYNNGTKNGLSNAAHMNFDRDYSLNSGLDVSDKPSLNGVGMNRGFTSGLSSQNLTFGLPSHLNYDKGLGMSYGYQLNQNLNSFNYNPGSAQDPGLTSGFDSGSSMLHISDSRSNLFSGTNALGNLVSENQGFPQGVQGAVDPTAPGLVHHSELSRNYSTPSLSNNHLSLLQQHYQELTKLLNDKDVKSAPKSSLSSNVDNNVGGGFQDLESRPSSTELSKKKQIKVRSKPKTSNDAVSSTVKSVGVSSSGISTPSKPHNSEFSRNNSSSNLLSNGSGGSISRTNRKHDSDNNKYSNAKIEDLEGRLYNVCKDQYGCRYLQKQLEEGSEKQIKMIFIEITPHFSKLMVDPFGNYLCQKLFEHCNESQRTMILKMISKDLVSISLNIHGTRAAQKLIDLLSTQVQIDYIIEALRHSVVALIRDLNGNHVIQKCLNKLVSSGSPDGTPENSNVQFIYDSVSKNCIEVATHRHGCCVFQRCIDVASPAQLDQLVEKVTENALNLVQDPFGNYVVQYIFDLNKQNISDKLISKFVNDFAKLSKQKFSSNVMEKSFKLANKDMQNLIVGSILKHRSQNQLLVLADLISDSFGNYVVQTILDFLIDIEVKHQLVDAIKLVQNNIKLTPYGKRIINKLYRDGFILNSASNCPSASNSRIPSPVNGNSSKAPSFRVYNQNQQSQQFQHIRNYPISSSISSPNLLSQNNSQGPLFGMHHDFNLPNNNGSMINTGAMNLGGNLMSLGASVNNFSNQPMYFNNPGSANPFMLFNSNGSGYNSGGKNN
ncbi:Pumilio domain-containing protein [Smittium mucronatum]|uniref:Pumilio domain-containing protein n=1 Tax=Smittium mucronatum TaxID=133383 RepID=A0A1R0GU94_9FUNG|nr:Pumilio domain-containing protein [Smittium mucronatum]